MDDPTPTPPNQPPASKGAQLAGASAGTSTAGAQLSALFRLMANRRGRYTLRVSDLTEDEARDLLAAVPLSDAQIRTLFAKRRVRVRGGRRPGQKTGTTANKEREIKAFMLAREREGLTDRAIARAVQSRYPGEELDRAPWNHVTTRKWINEAKGALVKIGKECAEPDAPLDNQRDGS